MNKKELTQEEKFFIYRYMESFIEEYDVQVKTNMETTQRFLFLHELRIKLEI